MQNVIDKHKYLLAKPGINGIGIGFDDTIIIYVRRSNIWVPRTSNRYPVVKYIVGEITTYLKS